MSFKSRSRNRPILRGAKIKVFARDPIFGGSCVPKPLPLKDSIITGVPQLSNPKDKKSKNCSDGGGVNKDARSINSGKNWGYMVQKLGKCG